MGCAALRQVLVSQFDLGANLAGWKLRSATAVSADGSVVVGYGMNPNGNREAWIARLGKQSSTDSPAIKVAVRMSGTR